MTTDAKISQLPAAAPLTGAELVPVVQAGVTTHTTVSAILAGASFGAFAIENNLSELAADPAAQAAARANIGLSVIDGGTFF